MQPLYLQVPEIEVLVNRILDNLAGTVSSQTLDQGIEVRYKIGVLRASIMKSLRDDTFSTKLLDCFTAAHEADAKLASLAKVLQGLFDETVEGEVSKMIVNQAIIFCLATMSHMISGIEFTSRDDAEVIMEEMRVRFETARDIISDLEDPMPYRTLLALAGALTNHLASTALKLPQVISIRLPTPMPALAVSQYVYQTANRWEELVDDNKIIHPAFCRVELKGLSS